jgi:Putative prokaryotic signal transducing protein
MAGSRSMGVRNVSGEEFEIGPKKIVPVLVTTDLAQAEIAKNKLIAEGIQCELERRTQGGFAEVVNIRVLVRAEDFDRARTAIEARRDNPEGE